MSGLPVQGVSHNQVPKYSRPCMFNFDPRVLNKTRAALARVRTGAGNMTLACVGTSATLGAGSNGAATNNCKVNSYPTRLSQLLNNPSFGLASEANSFFGNGKATQGFPASDPRVTMTGAFTADDNTTLGGFALRAAAAGTLSFTPAVPVDTFAVYYFISPSAGNFYPQVDSQAVGATVVGSGAFAIGKQTYACGSLGTHTMNCIWDSGTCYILGIHGYNSAVPAVAVHNMGIFGATAANLTTASAGPFATQFALPYVAPDLTIIGMTINDWIAGTPDSIYIAQMQSVISAALTTGDCILMVEAPSAIASAPQASQNKIIADVYQLAIANNIALVDQSARFGSFVEANSLSFMFDNLHCDAAGYFDQASPIASALLTL
jgi:hypothetical protein